MRTTSSTVLLVLAMIAPVAAHPPSPSQAVVQREFGQRDFDQREFATARSPAHIDLPPADSFLYRHLRNDDSDGPILGSSHAPVPSGGISGPSINIGAFHAEIGGTGTHAHLAHYTLEGVRVMGGSVSGSIDGKSARIAIDW